jgi:hypothetical protein
MKYGVRMQCKKCRIFSDVDKPGIFGVLHRILRGDVARVLRTP